MKLNTFILTLAVLAAVYTATDVPDSVDYFVSGWDQFTKVATTDPNFYTYATDKYRVDTLKSSTTDDYFFLTTIYTIDEQAQCYVFDEFNKAVAKNAYFVQPMINTPLSEVFLRVVPAPKYFDLERAKILGANIFGEKEALTFVRKLLTIAMDVHAANLVFGGASASQVAVTASNDPYVYLYNNIQNQGEQTLPRSKNINDPFYKQKKIGETVTLDSKIDTWGMGQVLYGLLAAGGFATPINFESEYAKMSNDTFYTIPANMSVEVFNVLDATLKFDPVNRVDLPALQEILDRIIATPTLTYTNETKKLSLAGISPVPPIPPTPTPTPNGNKTLWIAGITILALLAIGLAVYLYAYRKTHIQVVGRNDQLAADMLI